MRLPLEQRALDRVDPLVMEARHFDVGADLDGRRRQALRNVVAQHLLERRVEPWRRLLVEDRVGVGDCQPEGLVRVSVLGVKRPSRLTIQLLHVHVLHLRDVAHDGVNRLRPLELLVALGDVLGGHTPLGQVDVPLLFVDAKDHHHLGLANSDQLVDRADPPPRELREQNHPFDVVVLEEPHVRAHLSDRAHLHHDHLVNLREFAFIHPAVHLVRSAGRFAIDFHHLVASLVITPLLIVRVSTWRRRHWGGGVGATRLATVGIPAALATAGIPRNSDRDAKPSSHEEFL